MEGLQFLLNGFAGALTPANLLFAFIGCVLGTMIGVLPGLGPAAGTAILIPLTFAYAIIRYRLMDVEVIIKRALVYAAALAAGAHQADLDEVTDRRCRVIEAMTPADTDTTAAGR